MHDVSVLILDLALLLGVAGVALLVARFLKQPVILGYIIAGFTIGPFTDNGLTLRDPFSLDVWAEMGVIFLLFTLGLHFSFSKLRNLGLSSLAATAFEVCGLLLLGGLIGHFGFGWSWLQSLFLGAIMSISSTMIAVKNFQELRLGSQKFVQDVFGFLVVEDLISVLLIVFLTTLALTQEIQGLELAKTGLKLGFFLISWFVFGLFLIPSLITRFRKFLSEETLLVISMGLCLSLAVAASISGFSAALGAFLMGTVLGETSEKERIEKLFSPIKDLFGAIFFTTVGMMIDPKSVVEMLPSILIVAAAILLGKLVFVTIGASLAGASLKTSFETATSLAQIGEFSFLFAGLAVSMKVFDQKIYSVAVGAAVILAFIGPYLLTHRKYALRLLEKLLPDKFEAGLQEVAETSLILQSKAGWRHLFQDYVMRLVFNGVVVITLFLVTAKGIYPWLQKYDYLAVNYLRWIIVIGTVALCSPFLWGIQFANPKSEELKTFVRSRLHPTSLKIFFLCRLLIVISLLSLFLAQFTTQTKYLIIFDVIFMTIAALGYRWIQPLYHWFEERFQKQVDQGAKEANPVPVMTPWDAHLSEFTIEPESNLVGRPLIGLSLREKFGLTITMIQRGRRIITAPTRDETLMPFDKIFVVGNDHDLQKFENFLAHEVHTVHENHSFKLSSYFVTEKSQFLGKTIRDSGLREATIGLVVGIERGGKRILNPDSNLIIQTADLLWIVGDAEKIRQLN